MKMRGKFIQSVISAVEAVIIISLLFSFVYVFVNAKERGEIYDVSKGWDVTIDGETFSDVDISNFIFPKDMGDIHEIVMHYNLNQSAAFPRTLRVYTRLSFLEVDLGDEILYHDGIRGGNPKGYVGMGYHFIQIPTQLKSQDLTIRIVAVEKNAISGLPNVALTASNEAYAYFVDENAIGIFVSVYVFVLGLVLTVISILYTYLNRDYFRLFLVGSFSMTAGFWCMCSQKVLQLFGVSIASNSSIEYFLMEMSLLPLIGYNITVRGNVLQRDKLILRILLTVTLLYDVVAACLHFTDTIHYTQFVWVFYVLALVDCIGMVFVGVGPVKKMMMDEKIFHYGLSVVGLFAFWKIIDYVYGNFLARGNSRLASITIPLAILVFVGAMILSYLSHLYDMILSQAQEEALTVLAYKDTLTGLFNRAKSEALFQQLNSEKHAHYIMINFDLNGLKKLNDTDGHTKGDLLITGFGKVLKEVFDPYGSSMRMGGDEFLVIIEGNEFPDIDELMKKFERVCQEVSDEVGVLIDASYGIAYSSEVYEPEAEQIFRMADERMYEMKVRTKKMRGQ